MINHTRTKQININPERVRELITQIEQQATNITELKEVKQWIKKQ